MTAARHLHLIDGFLDGSLSAEDLAVLDSSLRQDDELLAAFTRAADLDRRLEMMFAEQEHDLRVETLLRSAMAPVAADEFAPPAPHSRVGEIAWQCISNYMALSALISGLFITTILLSLALWTVPALRPAVIEGRPEIVAQISQTRQATWDKASDGNFKNRELFAGERLLLASGLAEVAFEDGAVVTLEGPAEFVIEAAGAGTLNQGKLVARVTPAAVGFAVHTPLATIVDLGTEFGVTVDSDQSASTTVFEGSVLVQQASVSGTTAREHVVKAGQAVLLEPGRVLEVKPGPARFRYARNLQTSVDDEGNLLLLPSETATVDSLGQVAWNGALKTGRDMAGPAQASFLHFDLEASSLAASEVESATLKLWLTEAQQFGASHTLVAAEPWRKPEGQPHLDLPITQSRYAATASSRREGDAWIPPATGQYHEVDVTTAVQSWLRDPAGNFGLVLHGKKSPTSGEYFTATYREYSPVSGSNPPLLVIKKLEAK